MNAGLIPYLANGSYYPLAEFEQAQSGDLEPPETSGTKCSEPDFKFRSTIRSSQFHCGEPIDGDVAIFFRTANCCTYDLFSSRNAIDRLGGLRGSENNLNVVAWSLLNELSTYRPPQDDQTSSKNRASNCNRL